MLKYLRTVGITGIFILTGIAQPLFAQGFLRADGVRIVNEKDENVLLRGMGLGGWMLQEGYMLGINRDGQQHLIRKRIETAIGKDATDIFYNKWLSNHTRKIDVDSMKRWGFNSVRLPMHFELYTLPIEKEPAAGTDTWLALGFTMTDSLLAWCKANKMYLILDLHAAPGGQGNDLNISDRDISKPSLWESAENQRKMVALWRKLADRYKNEEWIGGYDIINEPNIGFQDPANDKNGIQEKLNLPLKKLLIDVTKAIREVDTKHMIIVEGNGWGNNYNGIFPLWDKNMVDSFHKYWNFNNLASIEGMLKTRTEQNVPIWLGETGENSNAWFTDAIRLFEANNIGWAWWPLKKLGYNNPLQISTNEGYRQLAAHWNNSANPAPGREVAYKGLMELAEDLKLERNIIKKDVIDAMMRQTITNATRPFKDHYLKDTLSISMVDYDLGRSGFAYHDTDSANYRVADPKQNVAGNSGGFYRNDGVDIKQETPGTYYVTDVRDGEWLQYTVRVAKAGKYAASLFYSGGVNAHVASTVNGNAGPDISLVNGLTKARWLRSAPQTLHLKAGANKLRLTVRNGGAELSRIVLIKI